MKQLYDLPEEVLLLIFRMCSAKDLSALSRTCVRLAQVAHTDLLWKELCWREYQVEDLGTRMGSGVKSYFQLYSQLLYRHGWMLGSYQYVRLPQNERGELLLGLY